MCGDVLIRSHVRKRDCLVMESEDVSRAHLRISDEGAPPRAIVRNLSAGGFTGL